MENDRILLLPLSGAKTEIFAAHTRTELSEVESGPLALSAI
jgi:hypothetical protein